MQNPCDACIALAFSDEPVQAPLEVGNKPPQEDKSAFRAKASSPCLGPPAAACLGTPALGGSSGSLPSRALACPRHQRGGSWSLLDPCMDRLDLALNADL